MHMHGVHVCGMYVCIYVCMYAYNCLHVHV